MGVLAVLGFLKEPQNNETFHNFVAAAVAMAVLPLFALFGAFYVFQNWAYGGVAAVIMVNVIILHYCYVCYLEEKRDYKPKTIVTVTATEEIRKAVKAQLGEDFRLKEGITLPGGATLSKGDLLRHMAPTSQDKALEAAELQFEQETRKDR
eukprot:GEMP01079601.1.p1 GENE.GEMP01079601.1~~GEMP01079601.1.p1  ORF type:complete len:159 (+),score=39.91 GEMP01079601.1:25-477(+)